MTKFYNHSS